MEIKPNQSGTVYETIRMQAAV